MEIKCPYCEKKIKGSTKYQLESLLLIHKISKHRGHLKIEEKE